ncbi:MAG: choice-of-anchor D domain-containing protein [Ilumatobacteraceae bacterium]
MGWIGEGNSSAAAPAELISVDPAGSGPLISTDDSPSVSGDGSIVVFTAIPPFSGVSLGNVQVAVRDRSAGTTTVVPQPFLVDRTTAGVVSRDGCHVAFWGFFTGFFIFFPAQWDIYTWDRCTAGSAPVQVSTAADFPLLTATGDAIGQLAISANGRFVAYLATVAGSPPRVAQIDTSTSAENRFSAAFRSVNSVDISDDGNFVAIGGEILFNRVITDLVVGWTPPCVAGKTVVCTTEFISVAPNGNPASGFSYDPSISADGRYVAFVSNSPDFLSLPATTVQQVYVRDRVAGVTKLVTDTPGQVMGGLGLGQPEISPDGTQIALTEQDQFENSQVWVARSTSGLFDSAAFDLVSFGVSGAPVSSGASEPSMSSNGRYVGFASTANTDLSGTTMKTDQNVWMRQRPIALDITPSLDFGTIAPGTTSAPQNAVVTNTSSVPINISSVAPPAVPFSITSNGCGGTLAPGAVCAVTLVFSPTAPGGASSSVTVSGDGLSVSSSLVGNGLAPPAPTPGTLTMSPGAANYGSGAIGTTFPSKRFTVSNPGQTAVPLAGAGLSGTGADQFAISGNTCTGSLAPGASCAIDVVSTVTREGAMSATLGVLGTGGQTAQAILRVRGTVVAIVYTPTLKMNPGVVSAGEVTAAIGSGFPPSIDVQLAFEGEPPFTTVHTDAAGAFRFAYLILRNGIRIGGRQVIAIDQPQFSGVRAPLLIDLATFRPAGFSSPAFTSGVRSLVSRGG